MKSILNKHELSIFIPKKIKIMVETKNQCSRIVIFWIWQRTRRRRLIQYIHSVLQSRIKIKPLEHNTFSHRLSYLKSQKSFYFAVHTTQIINFDQLFFVKASIIVTQTDLLTNFVHAKTFNLYVSPKFYYF